MTPLYHATQLILLPASKVCTKCHQEKPLGNFTRDRQKRDGYRSECKQCRNKPHIIIHFEQTKICTKCGKEKHLEDFSTDPHKKDGRDSKCKVCKAAYAREHRRNPKFKPTPHPGHKFCGKCHQEKPVEEFHKQKLGLYGVDSTCKACKKAYQHTRRQTPEYQEYDRKRAAKRRLTPVYQTYFEASHEKRREMGRAYRKAHPEKVREKNLRRKAQMLKAIADPVDYKCILERDGYYCYLCEKPIDPTAKPRTSTALVFDHVIPLDPRPGEPQGTHAEDNIKPAHNCCNSRKGNIPLEMLTNWQRRGP